MNPSLETALQALPHGREFRFIDRLIALVPGRSGTGEYVVRGDETFLRGHFPGAPLFPGVLLVEAGAQLAGAVAQSDTSVPAIQGLKLAGIKSARFYGSAVPGALIRVEALVTARLEGVVQAETSAYVGEAQLMSAVVTLAGAA